MKNIKLVSSLIGGISVVTTLVSLTSCNNQTSKTTITFSCTSGGKLKGGLTEKVDKGTLWKTVILPLPIPEKGFKFDNWYLNNQLIDPNYVIDVDINPIAKFIAE